MGGSIEAVEVAEKTVEGRITTLQGMKNPNTVFAGLEQGQIILVGCFGISIFLRAFICCMIKDEIEYKIYVKVLFKLILTSL